VSEQRLHDLRDECNVRALQHVNMRAIALTTRDTSCVARRKCLTFTREYVSMHVMEHSNAAVARGEKGSPSGFGTANRNERRVFTVCNTQTAETIDIAATEDMKLTAIAAGSCPP
jgi:nucleoid DNA-binding protein